LNQPNSKRSAGRRGVRREIIVGASALTIRLVFEIVALAISSNQRPHRSTPRRPERSVSHSA